MNTFILFNEFIFWKLKKHPWVGRILIRISQVLFPNPVYAYLNSKVKSKLSFSLGLKVYGIVLIFCAYLPYIFSSYYQTLGPNHISNTIEFLDDYPNLLNYLIFVQGYFICGVAYMLSLSSLDRHFKKYVEKKVISPTPQLELVSHGKFGVILIVCISTAIIWDYVNACQNVKNPYWFHSLKSEGLSYGIFGFYYFLLNWVLNIFVTLVLFYHFGAFLWVNKIRSKLREAINEKGEKSKFWEDHNNIKLFFYKFSMMNLWSKGFIAFIALNLVSFTRSGLSNDLSSFWIILFIVVGLWLTSLPRFIAQHEIYEALKKNDILEYRDIQPPIIQGISKSLNVFLLFITGQVLIGDNFFDTALFKDLLLLFKGRWNEVF